MTQQHFRCCLVIVLAGEGQERYRWRYPGDWYNGRLVRWRGLGITVGLQHDNPFKNKNFYIHTHIRKSKGVDADFLEIDRLGFNVDLALPFVIMAGKSDLFCII